ncbi:MAG: S-layer homology domain-containing protein [Oscillospiraceae bacterium]|nr:S-layer homology domain-containing protein [Oscillospiraceae bacterium]
MKKRMLALLLVLCLTAALLAVPVSAEEPLEGYNYLKSLAQSGEYAEEEAVWYVAWQLDEELPLYYGIYYYVNRNSVQLVLLSEDLELALECPKFRDSRDCSVILQDYTNEVGLVTRIPETAVYTLDSELEINFYDGAASLKDSYYQSAKQLLTLVLEYTADLLSEGGYTLRDIDFASFRCAHHLWDEGSQNPAPSCTEAGLMRYVCLRCGETREETLPALGHSWRFTQVLTEPEGDDLHSGAGLYSCSRCGETKEDRLCAGEIFSDMPREGNWAHDPIDWAYFNGISSGKTASTFAPKATVTRAEVVSFLYKLMGSPAPASSENPFTDVKEGKYYYNPVLWAVGAEVSSGVSPTRFGPRQICTRAQIVTLLWNAAGKPEPRLNENPFVDVGAGKYYYKAVLWAYENHVTGGVTATSFGAGKPCTRAQTVAFLYKAYELLTADPLPEEP